MGKKYAIAVKSWENNWENLATFFHYPAEIRRLIYTTNAIEGYNRGLRKVIKTKSSFPTPEEAKPTTPLSSTLPEPPPPPDADAIARPTMHTCTRLACAQHAG